MPVRPRGLWHDRWLGLRGLQTTRIGAKQGARTPVRRSTERICEQSRGPGHLTQKRGHPAGGPTFYCLLIAADSVTVAVEVLTVPGGAPVDGRSTRGPCSGAVRKGCSSRSRRCNRNCTRGRRHCRGRRYNRNCTRGRRDRYDDRWRHHGSWRRHDRRCCRCRCCISQVYDAKTDPGGFSHRGSRRDILGRYLPVRLNENGLTNCRICCFDLQAKTLQLFGGVVQPLTDNVRDRDTRHEPSRRGC